jgi:hypothetical protein
MYTDKLMSSIEDQNIYPGAPSMLQSQYLYNEDNDYLFKSPIAMRGGILVDQRSCFTEAKVPFKNATNDTNRPSFNQGNAMMMGGGVFTAEKKTAIN